MEDSDPLGRLRALQEDDPDGTESTTKTYLAFKAVNRRQLRLHVKSAHTTGSYRGGERLTYSYLHRILDDDGLDEQLALVFQFCVVMIRGRNLFSVAEAIEREVCEWIQPFDPVKWERPTDPKAPYIESIDIRVDREQMLKLVDEFAQDTRRR